MPVFSRLTSPTDKIPPKMKKHPLFVAICSFLPVFLNAQSIDSAYIAAHVALDSVLIVASKSGFDVADFIRLVQEDKTYADAFQRLRVLSWRGAHDMVFYPKGKGSSATYQSKSRQTVVEGCRRMEVDEVKASKNFFQRDGSYRFLTAELYDRVFFTHGVVCADQRTQAAQSGDAKGLDKYYRELKKFIFEPGIELDLPFIGGKTAIFSPGLLPYYDVSIRGDSSSDGRPCYVFSMKIKPAFEARKENRTIVKFLETSFERGSLQVLERRYSLAYAGIGFDFDVDMHVVLGRHQELYYPREVRYSGTWDIPLKPRERGDFKAVFTPYP